MCPDTERSGRLAFPHWEELEPTSLPPGFDVFFAAALTAITTKIIVFSNTFSPMFSLNGRHEIIFLLSPRPGFQNNDYMIGSVTGH
jgi:hypothetical protein